MSIFEYNEERHLAYIREKGREEGRREEREHSIVRYFEMLKKRGDSEEDAVSTICEMYRMEREEVRDIIGLKQC